ncbi:MAG: ribulose-phosphate 3-epimerase, ribulose-phosphate 3-epimerase [archaeon GW2011_AR3]|nr:MAG: ribulose-phosphate 3-epimerase, ribulose-phosphate 3-epimerase [archaeon GW2011_AR3]MBS3109487.1 ribulose-phosphate 3-epimerase [Candidatus Woesearchaeota archaeon]
MGKHEIKIVPSVLSANFGRLQEDVDKVANADLIQIDVMDGHFVKNISFGTVVMKDIRTKLKLDAHLMIENPELYIKDFADAGADIITFHVEAAKDPMKVIGQIKALGKKAGMAINPETPASSVFEYLPHLEQVIVMTVNPGWGGQKFIVECLDKVKEIRARWDGDIEVDGGVNDKTIADCARAGANLFVAGSFVFKSNDPAGQVELLRKKASHK